MTRLLPLVEMGIMRSMHDGPRATVKFGIDDRNRTLPAWRKVHERPDLRGIFDDE
jgi:hypothetical protein